MPKLASYDYRGLGAMLRARLVDDGRGWRVCADEIGVCASDLSRICNGQSVSAPKVIAVCDWLKLAVRAFYEPPSASRAEPAASPPGAPAGRANGRDGQSPLPPSADEPVRETGEMFHGKSTETAEATNVR
ncbi:hypothetical protein [Mesorhizobium captivum]|uniref:hypothetical protein n=1 Tax=Mesorhizobium captivum TaxID=3072319 RepID=UPI002A24BC53|nr:hypothetical protein [Mesorhizobium sp. VK23E]MDX8513555.1 hypothetical protein [Mesorhizobium sp. VK23E]